ncbi:MAG: GDCCVxC domain-containing (seleno)protein [Nitrospirota bacterium]
MSISTHSILTCPHCGTRSDHEMPTNACVIFVECEGCHSRLSPKPGECCVFCSYGSIRCPPVQLADNCGRQA